MTLATAFTTFPALVLIFSTHVVAEFINPTTEGLIVALGDFNNDKYVDIAAIDNGQKSFTIWFYKKKDGTTISKQGQDSYSPTLKGEESLDTAVPGDFDGDNTLDLALFVKTTSLGNLVLLKMFTHNKENALKLEEFNYTKGGVSSIYFQGEPLVADVNGDQIPDFIGNINDSVQIVHTVDVEIKGESRKAYKPYPFAENSTKASDTCGHSFAHVVGDDQPDVILCMDTSFQIWKGNKGQYTKVPDIPFPDKKKYGTGIVIDIDMDGEQELVLPVCADDACDVSEIYYYEVEKQSEEDIVPSKDNWKLFHSFAEDSVVKTFNSNQTTLRAGDVDFDGYPDFLAVMSPKGKGSRKLYVLGNQKCSGSSKVCAGSRDLSSKDLGLDNVATGTFFDYKEDGGNNLIYSKFVADKYTMASKDISDKGDSAFLKVMVIGGNCGPGGKGDEDCRFGEDVNYGANLPGPTIKYETHGSDGKKRKAVWTQLSQSAHQALQGPSVIFGLGQVPNFVEKLTITLGSSEEKIGEVSMENVIPNSQLILIPYPPNNPDKWTFQLLLTPSDIIWKFAIALFSVVVVLAIIVGILQWQEKREDDAEKREEAHKFHFDAM